MGRNRVSDLIRAKLRAWLGIADPIHEPPTVEAEAQRKGISIAQELLHRAGQRNLVHRPLKLPQLPPGVIPTEKPEPHATLGASIAHDSESIAPYHSYANQFNCGLAFPGYAYLAELSQRSEYRLATGTIAEEMTREFIKLVVKDGREDTNEGEDDPSIDPATGEELGTTRGEKLARVLDTPPIVGDVGKDLEAAKPRADDDEPDTEGDEGEDNELEEKIAKLEEAIEKFKVRALLRTMAEYDGLFGRGQLLIDVDSGGDVDEARQLPLLIDKETIKQGTLKGFKAIEPIWTTPYSYNATDPTADDFYKPRAWWVLGKRVHASRMLTFIMRPVPDILKPSYNFGGLSLTQLMESDVYQWLRTRNSVSDLVHNFSVMCLATDMSAVLGGDADKPGGLMDRVKLFVNTRDNQGLTVLDKEREEMKAVNVPLSTLDKLLSLSKEQIATPAQMPLVKYFGITPGGLNSSSEEEIQVWYDHVRATQQAFYGDHLNTILQVLQLHLFGEIDDAISFEFIPLSTPTVKEQAEIRKADAETADKYVSMGALDPAEVRERIASDPNSGYNNISGPPPDPQDLVAHQLADKTAANTFERSEESADNAHARQLEADAQNAKLSKTSKEK